MSCYDHRINTDDNFVILKALSFRRRPFYSILAHRENSANFQLFKVLTPAEKVKNSEVNLFVKKCLALNTAQ